MHSNQWNFNRRERERQFNELSFKGFLIAKQKLGPELLHLNGNIALMKKALVDYTQ